MTPVSCLTTLYMSILAVLIMKADSEDSGCDFESSVRRNTVYNATPGECLSIDCPVRFCNDSPPTVSWFKLEKTRVPVNVSSDSHIKTEWTLSNHLKGISHLVFQQILRSHSGLYQCRFGGSMSHVINVSVHEGSNDTEKNNTSKKYVHCGSVSHTINVSVHGTIELTTVTGTTEKPAVHGTPWHYGYRIIGIAVFFILVIAICVVSKSGFKGGRCVGKSRNTSEPSCQPTHHELSIIHIYENDQ